MALVDIIKSGDTTIMIHDDFCKNTTPEEVEAVMVHIAKIALPFMRVEMQEEKTG